MDQGQVEASGYGREDVIRDPLPRRVVSDGDRETDFSIPPLGLRAAQHRPFTEGLGVSCGGVHVGNDFKLQGVKSFTKAYRVASGPEDDEPLCSDVSSLTARCLSLPPLC